MSTIDVVVTDLVKNEPAVGVKALLEKKMPAGWEKLGSSATNDEGKVEGLLRAPMLDPGTYRLSLASGEWYRDHLRAARFPYVDVLFEVLVPFEDVFVSVELGANSYGIRLS